ncbi:type II toxin-antitoxin system RelE/ParE family toxin [bacterium]|jgi:plasmid stabilization system protein ParE|nr:type II toxin-antitoxin system RelE/ParE family toxin [bacterium]MDC1221106.1 type II toxin-antitoxin system RelE/ParE family toxin [Salibacteraceae bacterium]
MLNIFLSPLAERQLELLLEYLELEWSRKSRETFLDKVKKSFSKISTNPKSCQESKAHPNIFKCVVTKQTSFYYRIVNNEIEIISVKDNRQDPDKIEEELKHWR